MTIVEIIAILMKLKERVGNIHEKLLSIDAYSIDGGQSWLPIPKVWNPNFHWGGLFVLHIDVSPTSTAFQGVITSNRDVFDISGTRTDAKLNGHVCPGGLYLHNESGFKDAQGSKYAISYGIYHPDGSGKQIRFRASFTV